MKTTDLPASVQARLEVLPNGCWAITGGQAYPVITINGDRWLAHRYIATLTHGFIPAGMTVDHVCHNTDPFCEGGSKCGHRRCINPAHLRIVSSAENTLASATTRAGQNIRRTTCVWGHPLEGDNLHIRTRTDGRRKVRVCLECQARRAREATVRRRNAVKEVAA